MSLTETATKGLTIAQWCARLNMSHSTIKRWHSEGVLDRNGVAVLLKGVRVGGAYRISEQSMEEFLAATNGLANSTAAAAA
jgi:predicted site-specific integrase-resolvase